MTLGYQVVFDCEVNSRVEGFEGFWAWIEARLLDRVFETTFGTHVLLGTTFVDPCFFYG